MLNKTLTDKFILSIKGFCMGAADVVPGVSGGTMAFILGIYPQLLRAISSFDGLWLQAIIKLNLGQIWQRPQLGFLIPLAIGIIAALFFFTRIIPLPQLIHTHPEPIYGLFFGLILGSIISLLIEVKSLNARDFFFLVTGCMLGWFIVNLVPTETPDASWFIFISGMIAIVAMILPGISGSFLLLIMKKYELILHAIGHLQFNIIIPFALGAVVGLAVASRFLTWLLAKFYRETLLTIIGVLIGTLWVIWPFQVRYYLTIDAKTKLISSTPYFPTELNLAVIYAILMFSLGLTLVLFIHWLKFKREK
jgi:putative membrane protein